jgi:hypothetical protein
MRIYNWMPSIASDIQSHLVHFCEVEIEIVPESIDVSRYGGTAHLHSRLCRQARITVGTHLPRHKGVNIAYHHQKQCEHLPITSTRQEESQT